MIGQAGSLLQRQAVFRGNAAGLCKKARFVVKYGVPKGSNSLVWLHRNLSRRQTFNKSSLRSSHFRLVGHAAKLRVEPDLRLKPDQV
jgi:hypothetical protein